MVIELRDQEVEQYLTLAKVEATVKPLGEITINVCIFFLMLGFILSGGILSPEKVYFSMTILNFMKRKILITASMGRIFFINFKLMIKRIEDILEVPEIQILKETQSPVKRRSETSD
jgi:hypothetical protein